MRLHEHKVQSDLIFFHDSLQLVSMKILPKIAVVFKYQSMTPLIYFGNFFISESFGLYVPLFYFIF